MYEEARQLLRSVRLQARLTQADLALATHFSEATIRSYESLSATRQRNPSREHLEAILRALYAPRDASTSIMEGFGYSTSRTLYPLDRFPDYFFQPDELDAFVELVPWPQFVVNSAVEIVAANDAAERLWGISLAEERARAQSGTANLLAVASRPEIASRIVNWEECLSTVIGVLRGQPERPEALLDPSERFKTVIHDFAANDGLHLARLFELWEKAPPLPSKVRWHYRVVWNDPVVGEMHFLAVVSTASEPAGLAFNDWQPTDSSSWQRIESLLM